MMLALLPRLAVAAAPPDIDAPLRTGAAAPNDAAVVIGIEDYAFLADVPSASRDSRAVYHWLVYTRGIPAERVALLQGGNREQILDAVKRARALLSPGGTLWVSYAGHGATSPADGGPLLVGDDAKPDPTVFQARSVPVTEFGKDAVLLLDTCWAGRGRDGTDLVPGARFAVPTWSAVPTTGAMVTAAQPSQLSEPYVAADHGLFSYFFVGGVRGWADGELDGAPDGQVTLKEAHAFASRAIATVHPSGQQPSFSGVDRVLVAAPGRLEAPPDLAALPKFGQRASAPAPAVPQGTPVLGSTAVYTGVPLLAPGKTWTGALTLGDDHVLTAPGGRRLSVLDAAQATSSDPAVARAFGGYQRAVAQQYTGGSLVVTGALLGGVYGLVWALSEETGSTWGATSAVYGVTIAATAGTGLGLVGLGTVHKKRERLALVEAINAAP